MTQKYIDGQRKCGLKVGDRVRIKEKVYNHYDDGNGSCEELADGWENSWDEWMDLAVGCEGIIKHFNGCAGITVIVDEVPWKDFGFDGTPEYMYPYWVLEKVEKFESKFWNITCKRCGAPAYQGLNNIECSRHC